MDRTSTENIRKIVSGVADTGRIDAAFLELDQPGKERHQAMARLATAMRVSRRAWPAWQRERGARSGRPVVGATARQKATATRRQGGIGWCLDIRSAGTAASTSCSSVFFPNRQQTACWTGRMLAEEKRPDPGVAGRAVLARRPDGPGEGGRSGEVSFTCVFSRRGGNTSRNVCSP